MSAVVKLSRDPRQWRRPRARRPRSLVREPAGMFRHEIDLEKVLAWSLGGMHSERHLHAVAGLHRSQQHGASIDLNGRRSVFMQPLIPQEQIFVVFGP